MPSTSTSISATSCDLSQSPTPHSLGSAIIESSNFNNGLSRPRRYSIANPAKQLNPKPNKLTPLKLDPSISTPHQHQRPSSLLPNFISILYILNFSINRAVDDYHQALWQATYEQTLKVIERLAPEDQVIVDQARKSFRENALEDL